MLPVQNGILLSYALFYTAYMSFFPFETMYLTGIGYGKGTIAVVTTVTAVANFLIQLKINRIVEKFRSIRKTISILLAVSALSTCLLYLFNGSVVSIIISILPVTIMDFCVISQLDAYTAMAAEKDVNVHYSTMRAVAGLTGAVSSSCFGVLYRSIGIEFMFAVHIILVLITVLSVQLLPKDVLDSCNVKKINADKLTLSSDEIKAWILVLIGGGLIFTGWRANITYLPLLLIKLGGDTSHQGLGMALMNLGCLPVLICYPVIRKKISISRIISVGSIFMAIRLCIIPIIRSAAILTAAQLFEALSYGLIQPAVMEMFTMHTKGGNRIKIIAVWTGIQMALATVAANAAVYILGTFMELENAFIVFSAVAIIGMTVLLTGYRKIIMREDADI